MFIAPDQGRRREVLRAQPAQVRQRTAFFDDLGPERAAALTHVSADAAGWIAEVVTERAAQAVYCLDPYHPVAWVSDALDAVRRRQVWNAARGGKGGRNSQSRPSAFSIKPTHGITSRRHY